jgi:hypothetical protein
VIKKIDVEDPPTQRAVAKSVQVSQSTVHQIIKNSGFSLRKKRRVQKLTTSNVIKRQRRSRRLYRQLANNRYKYFIRTDEAWFYLDGKGGKPKVCYIKKSDPDYDRMIIQQDTCRPKGFMVWGGVSSRGKTALRFVAPGVKVNANYYITNILKPFLAKDVPRLFPKEGKNGFFIKIQHQVILLQKQLTFLTRRKLTISNQKNGCLAVRTLHQWIIQYGDI